MKRMQVREAREALGCRLEAVGKNSKDGQGPTRTNTDEVGRQIRRMGFEVRADSAETPTKIVGYAAVFGQVAYGEMIQAGAFSKTLSEGRDIKAYWSHQMSHVLARRENGTLRLEEDAHGLKVEIKPNPDTTWGRDALGSVARGDVTQMSFGFWPVNSEWRDIDGQRVEVLTEIRLFEVSPVAEPWYEGTAAEAREKGSGECGVRSGEYEGKRRERALTLLTLLT